MEVVDVLCAGVATIPMRGNESALTRLNNLRRPLAATIPMRGNEEYVRMVGDWLPIGYDPHEG